MNKFSDLKSDVHCRVCDGTGLIIPLQLLDLQMDIERLLLDFPNPDIMGKGQWFFTPATIVRTLSYMYVKTDIEGKSIACLASPTIGMGLELLRKKAELTRTNITILDIDEDVLQFINTNLPDVETIKYDYQEECPGELVGKFDCFFFDPLYAEDHYRIGLSRCVDLIGHERPNKNGYVVVPPEEIAPIRTKRGDKNIPIQLVVFKFLNDMNFCIVDFRNNFIEYTTPKAEVGILTNRDPSLTREYAQGNWRGSELIRVASTAETKPLEQGVYSLIKRVNEKRRLDFNQKLLPLAEIEDESIPCQLCLECFSLRIEEQKVKGYRSYQLPQVYVCNMPSWRAEDDQPFEVAPACAAFENTDTGELIILKGPTSKAIWETLRDLSSISEDTDTKTNIEYVLNQSLLDYDDLNFKDIQSEVKEFVSRLLDLQLIKNILEDIK